MTENNSEIKPIVDLDAIDEKKSTVEKGVQKEGQGVEGAAKGDTIKKKTKKQKPKNDEVAELKDKLELLTALVIEMGTNAGQGNTIRHHGYPPFLYIKQDKYERRL